MALNFSRDEHGHLSAENGPVTVSVVMGAQGSNFEGRASVRVAIGDFRNCQVVAAEDELAALAVAQQMMSQASVWLNADLQEAVLVFTYPADLVGAPDPARCW